MTQSSGAVLGWFVTWSFPGYFIQVGLCMTRKAPTNRRAGKSGVVTSGLGPPISFYIFHTPPMRWAPRGAGMQARDHYCNSRAVTFLGLGSALARCVDRPKTNSWDRSHSDTNPVGTRPPKQTRAESEQLPLPLLVPVKAPLSVLPCGGQT